MSGMKVYTTDEKELIMEPTLKWAGNPNILVAVKAFGLRATVQVLNHLFMMDPTIMGGKEKAREKKDIIYCLYFSHNQYPLLLLLSH